MTTAEFAFDKQQYQTQVCRLWNPTLRKFQGLIRVFVLFNLFFLIVAGFEIALFLSFFALLTHSTVLAFALAIFFLTLFPISCSGFI